MKGHGVVPDFQVPNADSIEKLSAPVSAGRGRVAADAGKGLLQLVSITLSG